MASVHVCVCTLGWVCFYVHMCEDRLMSAFMKVCFLLIFATSGKRSCVFLGLCVCVFSVDCVVRLFIKEVSQFSGLNRQITTPSIHPSIHPSTHPSIHPSIHPYYPSISLSLSVFHSQQCSLQLSEVLKHSCCKCQPVSIHTQVSL